MVRDIVHYAVPFGALGRVFHGLLVRRNLGDKFGEVSKLELEHNE